MQVNVVDKILDELLRSGDSAQNYIQGSRRMKIDNRIHLDNKVQERKVSLATAFQSHSKRSKKHMSMKQHKKYGSLDLPQEFHKWVFFNRFFDFGWMSFSETFLFVFCYSFEKFKPMHEIWKGYVMQLLKSVG